MNLPEPIAKLRDEEATQHHLQYLAIIACEVEGQTLAMSFRDGANWGFEQGVLYAVELLRGGLFTFDHDRATCSEVANRIESQLDEMRGNE